MKKKAALHNLGCKVNAYETEAMSLLLEEAGYEIVPFAPGADLYVINTCTVTNIADRKSRQMLHKARKMNPQAIVVAAGCYVQTALEPVEDDPAIDIVLGNNKKNELIEAIRYFEETRRGAEEGCVQSERMFRETADDGAQTAKISLGTTDENAQTAKISLETTAENAQTAKISLGTTDENAQTAEISLGTTDENAQTGEAAGKSDSEKACEDSRARKIDINHTKEYEQLFVSRTQEHTRAYIKVQDGCNQFCSYCIIPYARGRVRSRRTDDVLREAKALAANGCREVVLTGIHLSSYGTDLGTDLLALIRAVHETDGIERIRLGSLEPGIITEAFAQELTSLPKLCPHFHLSLQSGCTATLKRMNRRYTAEEFEEKCRILRRVFDRPAITTDVIVGFPGETQEEFDTTVAFLKRIQLYETHIFKYSRRHGTRAAAMPDQIPEQVKGVRSDILIELGEHNRSVFERQYAGEQTEVLFEEKVTVSGQEYYTGYTKQYIKVAIPADENYENRLVTGRLGAEVEPHLFTLEPVEIRLPERD